MRNAIDSFRGEAPRLTPRALPPNGAQQAYNARLLSGDLEAWRQFSVEQLLDNTGPVLSIYKHGDAWRAWDADVDVAKGALAGETSGRIFLTGPDFYDRPRWTNTTLAGAGNGPPAETRPLGVPGPEGSPTVTPGIDPNPTTTAVDVFDEGDSLAADWTATAQAFPYLGDSHVYQDAGAGDPAPSYTIAFGRNVGSAAYFYRDFGIASLTAIRLSFNFMFRAPSSGETYKQMVARFAVNLQGQGVFVGWGEEGIFGIGRSSGGWNITSQSTLVSTLEGGVPAHGVWYTCNCTMLKNADDTQTVTATLYLGSAQLATVTATNNFSTGGYCGFIGETSNDSDASPFLTSYDNILVQASGPSGYIPTNTASSYVYTYKNDQGEESAPSFASETVLRPVGVAITVATPTDVPTGIDSSWHIETKTIYRSVTGASGTIFRFVAEIPLAQAEYVDNIPDTELGEELESEGWELPPVDMKGILALPNGTMAGVSKNQLCLSAQNRPHAWPLRNRYTVDTDVVAIGNIDTTVVLGTEAFPYLAIGTSPGDYSMTKLEVPQACVSKRSLAYLIGFGVVFASPDGLIAIAGNGNVQNLTRGLFTRKQWQALVPESILGIAHDDVYHFFYATEPDPPPVVTETVILLNPSNPASLTYGAAYLSAFPTAVGFDNGDAGFKSSGSSGVIADFSGISGVTVSPADSATASAKGDTRDITALVVACEFTMQTLGAGVRVAVGSFSPSFGPPGNLDSFLVGFPSLTTYWSSYGIAFGYGELEQSVATYEQGDVIGIVFVASTTTAHFFKNGVQMGFTAEIADVNSVYLFASVEPPLT